MTGILFALFAGATVLLGASIVLAWDLPATPDRICVDLALLMVSLGFVLKGRKR